MSRGASRLKVLVPLFEFLIPVTIMKRLAVLNVVGLTKGLLADKLPQMQSFAAEQETTSFTPAFPAVTTTAQATYLTGRSPGEHGIVGNGWFEREDAEVRFWKQSITSSAGRNSGKRWRGNVRASVVPRCSGGTTCIRARIGR